MARLSFQMVLDFKKRFRFIILHLYFEEKVESRLADEVLPININGTKVYAQRYVNKSITALFINYGIYCLCRKISISYSKISFFIS